MNKLFLGIALTAVLVTAPGCCTTRNTETQVSVDSYVAAIEKIQSNLEQDILPGYQEALESSNLIPELQEARLGVVRDTITLCKDTLTGAAEEPNVTVEVEGD